MSLKQNKADAKLLTAQEFICVEDIADGVLYAGGYLFGFLGVHAGDSRLFSETERAMLVRNLTAAMSSMDEKKPFQLLSIPRTVDTMGLIDYLNERRRLTREEAKLRLINGEIGSLRDLEREGAKEPMITVKLWESAARGADVVLKNRLNGLRDRLIGNGVSAEVLDDREITNLCKLFADLTSYQEGDETVFEEVPTLPGRDRAARRKDNEQAALRDLIAPVGGLAFGVSRVTVGTVVGRIYGAMRYPAELDYGWATAPMNASNCVTSITYYPGDSLSLGNALSRSIQQSAVEANSANDARKRKHYERQAADAGRMIDELDFNGAAVGHIEILVMPFCGNEDELEDTCRAAMVKFAAKRIGLRALGSIQKDAYKHLSPYYPPQRTVDDVVRRLCPLETLMGGFPMTVNRYRDDRGKYFARTMDGGVMALDLLYRGRDRTSSNLVATGKTGMGKSTAIKHLMLSMYMDGTKILVIDPEREFRDLCAALDGSWFDAGGGRTKVNPLQVRPVPPDDEEVEDTLFRGEDNALAAHIHVLDMFFHLRLPSLTDLQRALLKKALIELYQKHGITWDTDVSTLSPEAFPLLSDLQRQLAKSDDPRCEELSILLYDLAAGADSFLWDGHTNVDVSNDFIVFDTNALGNSPDEVKRAQYFNILTLCWQVMSEDRKQPVLLVCDEGHILFDPQLPQVSMYLRNYAKRARKYEGGLWLITQQLVDLLGEQVKLSGQAILDCATYKLFFGADGKDLEETADLFKLTEAEKNILLSQQREHALLVLGEQRIHVHFAIPSYKLQLMGEGGGR